jgi:luciferase family oxidoreductase group 1
MPVGETVPDVWLLGSSDQSAAVAAHFGRAFSFAHFITDRNGPALMQAYRDAFKPASGPSGPVGNIGVFVLCADTEAEAERLATSRDLWRVRLDQGYLGPFPSIEEAETYPYSELERRRIRMNRRRMVIGAPEQVRARIIELGEAYGVEEIVVVTICHEFAPRLRSYELLAELFALDTRTPSRAVPVAQSGTHAI